MQHIELTPPPGLRNLYLGCPFWGFRPWVGNFYRRDAKPRDFLKQYSSAFNTVEGNTTFYSLPSSETVLRWRDQTPPSFRFSFKFPQTITHERQLKHVDRETAQFLRRIAPLEDRVGPIMLQFPKALSPSEADVLWRFLPRLPKDFRYAVELRHPDFFRNSKAIRNLEDELRRTNCERVIMDTRALRSGPAFDKETREAFERKPNLPVHPGVVFENPIIRFIGHPLATINEPWIRQWSLQLASWIEEGLTPYFFVHCPNNVEAPPLARNFHNLLQETSPVGNLPPWPVELEGPEPSQLELF